jgi:hypothetical protein
MSLLDPKSIETRIAALNQAVIAGEALLVPGDVVAVLKVQADHYWAKAASVRPGPLRDTKGAQGWRVVAHELEAAAKSIENRLGLIS